MKTRRFFKFIIYGAFFLFLASGCTKDTIVPINIEDKVFSFSDDIEPIIKQNCSASSCHGGSVKPDFTGDIYSVLQNGGFIVIGEPEKAEESKLYKKLNGTHGDERITPLTRRSLEIWMEQGAKNN